ncbi:helix-turn-helix domain-containing protein [Lentilactobacillus hilgardii]|uniref:Uncharacterized protein n=1 Tax=Lentilactobacillus hilgardii (strain ATCC 8290 / DSM 20176 / CCUG 30140 / JCM 1155 / KCTC 3500 / NBRC 15886 / NCIMB 8040 / NRRL B-1843 / 9) TaxID=1423757 RepID=C0XIK4_LENH9|nr:hypothetical protein [Lentilactobacillus hilgardii]EEI24774.1 hypothetical protein HMPREF0519_1065 [Lentilactobacillus hilgardii DSM 20176 = ATCC 8290]KRK57661.1 hypothetical protein FD42_GL002235 [Lentilactobacillus hilgardii DSM 20176 = ATCC 8290]QEU37477.1 hypothetical protein LH500_00085 [Lentilactobacillus hilgardii]TDG83442.1 hypothetical protein C5L34_001964 [Lentilactobacillus hilgardii]
MPANKKIREEIQRNDLLNWAVATQIGIADTTLSRWLRTPLNQERRKRVEKAIKELTKAKE